MYSSAKLSLSALPFLVHWAHWPCLWALIVSFRGLKDARWGLDVLKRRIVKPVCDWQITSLAFLWLEKTLNKLLMCSTARWIVHRLHAWMWIALNGAAEWVLVSVCVCVHLVKCCLYSQRSRPGVSLQWQDRGRSALTYRTTHLRKNSPLCTSPFSLSLPFLLLRCVFFFSDSLVSDPDRDPPELLYSALLPPFFSSSLSLTWSVSLYSVFCAKIPCGRVVSKKNTSAHCSMDLPVHMCCF